MKVEVWARWACNKMLCFRSEFIIYKASVVKSLCSLVDSDPSKTSVKKNGSSMSLVVNTSIYALGRAYSYLNSSGENLLRSAISSGNVAFFTYIRSATIISHGNFPVSYIRAGNSFRYVQKNICFTKRGETIILVLMRSTCANHFLAIFILIIERVWGLL